MTSGKLGTGLAVDLNKVQREKSADTRGAALGQLQTSLQKLLAAGLKDKKAIDLKSADIQKTVNEGLGNVRAQLMVPEIAEEVQSTIKLVLGEAVSKVEVVCDSVRVVAEPGGLSKVRAQQAVDASRLKRIVAIDNFGNALSGYLDLKLGKGDHGLKPPKVQGYIDEALKAGAWERWELPDADAKIGAKISEVLDGLLLGEPVLTGGTLQGLAVDPHRFAEQKSSRKANGRASAERGNSGDNARRMMVADALRDPLMRLNEELKAEVLELGPMASAANREADLDLTDDRLSRTLTRALKAVAADAQSAAGQSQIAASILEYLPMVESVKVDRGLAAKAMVTTKYYFTFFAGQESLGAERDVVKKVTDDVKKAVGQLVKGPLAEVGIRGLTKSLLEPIVVTQAAVLTTAGLPADMVDAQLSGALQWAISELGSPGANAVVSAGKLTSLVMRDATSSLGGRPEPSKKR